MNGNILSILGVSAREDVISNLLRYCIEASPEFRDTFLADICKVPAHRNARIQALTRVSTGESGVPDLVITVEEQSQKHLVILENKLKAEEGGDQTKRYSSGACVEDLKRRFGWDKETPSLSFVFLTLFPDAQPATTAFRSITYQVLLDKMRTMGPINEPMARLLLDSWRELLESFYSNMAVRDNDILLPRLQEAHELEGNYLYFTKFLDGLSLPCNLSLDWTFRSSARGRRYFGAVISKPSWRSAEMQETNGQWHIDGATHFFIHFEPQFHYLRGILELYLHYEVNPYQPLEWVRQHIKDAEYEAYRLARDTFVAELAKVGIPELKIGGASNQIAKASLALTNETVSAARASISSFVGQVAQHIDDILESRCTSTSLSLFKENSDRSPSCGAPGRR